ncbi:MAG: peroxiredoxin [Melioribacteraceae bacterium]
MKTIKHIFAIVIIFLVSSCGGTADNISVGDDAPSFTLEDAKGNSFTLSDYKDKSPVIIYFYPKANTPGCTKQACAIRDDYSKFEESGITIFGISVDDKEDIQEFMDDYDLNFPLLSDSKKTTSKDYGVLNNLGFASRISFIIDKESKIAKIMKDFDIDKHSQQVLDFALTLK